MNSMEAKNYAIVFAGGHGTRMGDDCTLPKQFIEINKRPILIHTLLLFQQAQFVDGIILIVPSDFHEYSCKLLQKWNITKVFSVKAGGRSAMESIHNGLVELRKTCSDDSIVVVHDGVRPMITSQLIDSSIICAQKNGTAVSAVPCTETILQSVDGGTSATKTLPRQQTYKGQAPQAYRFKMLWDAFESTGEWRTNSDIVDCASLLLSLKKTVKMIPGEYGNVKITTPSDVSYFEFFLKNKPLEKLAFQFQSNNSDNNILSHDKTLKEDMDKISAMIPVLWRNKIFLVTGGTGMIGRQIVLSLLTANQNNGYSITVIVVTRDIAKAKKMFSSFPNRKSLRIVNWEKITDFSADYVIHCAAPTSSSFFVDFPVETIHSIYKSTETILEYAKEKKCSGVIFLSSMEVYGDTSFDNKQLQEKDLGNLDTASVRNSYPMAKRMAEMLCMSYYAEYHLPVAVLRLAQTFGAWVDKDDQRVFAYFARSVINHEDIVLVSKGKTYRNYCYTADAISAIFTVLKQNAHGEIFNVANENTGCSILEMAEMAAKLGDIKVKIALSDNERYRSECRTVLNAKKIMELGWKPEYSMENMLKRMISSMNIYN